MTALTLDQSNVLIAGGASGLGEATARYLAARGVHSIILDRDVERGVAIARELVGQITFVSGDVTKAEDVDRALAAGDGRPVRFAVVSAMFGSGGGVLDSDGAPHDLDLYRRSIEVNLTGTFNVLSRAAAHFAKLEPDTNGQRGAIVTTASISGYDGQNGQIAYAAAKAGVIGMTLPAARDLAPLRIRIMCVAPGTFATPVVEALSSAHRRTLAESALFPDRLGRPDEYARLVAHILENDYLNGEVIRIDSGTRLARFTR